MPNGVETRRDSRHAEEVVLGADDFLFHCFGNAFEQLCGDAEPADRQLAQWVSLFENNFAWCTAKKTRYVTLVVPERHVIYADKLPPGRTISPRRPINRLIDAMDPAMRAAVLYPEQRLSDARRHDEVFYKTDEHLNLHGHYTCYRALFDHFGPTIMGTISPREAPVVAHRVQASGNLGIRLDTEPMEVMEGWGPAVNGATRRIFRNRNAPNRVEVYQHDDHARPKAIVFGDSHMEQLRYWLIPHFSRTIILYYCHQLFCDLVRVEQPDVVVHIMSELNLGKPPASHPLLVPNTDFFSYSGEELPPDLPLLAIDFGRGGGGSEVTGEGWSFPEEDHTWMTGTTSTLTLPIAICQELAGAVGGHTMTINLWPVPSASPRRRVQRLTISYEDDMGQLEIGNFEIDRETELVVSIPQLRSPPDGKACLKFEHPNGFAPRDEGQNDDRILSVGVRRLRIAKAS